MKKRIIDLGERIKRCGNITGMYWDEYRPDNDVYNAIDKKIIESEYPVLPIVCDGEIPLNKAFSVNIENITFENDDNVKDCINAIIEAKYDMWGDLHSIFDRSACEKVREYYADTALCYGYDISSGSQIIFTRSEAVKDEMPIIRKRDALKGINIYWHDFDKYTVFRFVPCDRGYYVIRVQINLASYYVCPLSFIECYMTKFKRFSEDNILLLEYNSKKENKVIKCTRNKIKIGDQLANYLDRTSERVGTVRVCDIERNKIVSIPIPKIISYIVLQHI